MEVVPNTATTAYPSSPAPSVGSASSATGQELNAQLLYDLGEIALLADQAGSNTGAQAQILQIVNFINSVPSSEIDPNVQQILNESGYRNFEIGGGNFNQANVTPYITQWGNTQNPNCTVNLVMNWLAGENGEAPFNPQTIQDPNTMFSYLMFMTSLQLTTSTTYQQDAQAFFSGSPNGELPTSTWAGMFLGIYLSQNPSLGSTIAACMNEVLGSSFAPYQNFIATFTSGSYDYATWQAPSNETAAQCEQCIMNELEQLNLPDNT